jgi:hypothetical protein
LEGKAIRAVEEAEVEEADIDGDDDPTRYLGPSTLAKIQSASGTDTADEDDEDFDDDDDDV